MVSTSICGAHAATGQTYVIAHNSLPFVQSAKPAGKIDPATAMDVTVWLKPHDQAGLDRVAGQLFQKSSPEYHKWLTPAAFAARFAPTADETQSVRNYLAAHNLSPTASDKFGFFVRAHGTIADVQTAFNVQIANVTFRGKTVRANLTDPSIADPAGALVSSVEGLSSGGMTHPLVAQSAILPHPSGPQAVAPAMQTDASGFNSVCFGKTTTQTIGNGTYTGNQYAFGVSGCGYTPPQIQAAYGLNTLYQAGLDGTGQTIVIVDWCGSPSITGDANAYSKKFGLPALTSDNFSIINYPAPSTCSAPDPEINIDVEWAHAIAPGAKITLLVPPSPTFPDIDAALIYEVEEGLGNIVSNSYGSEEAFTDPSVLTTQNFILQAAAVTGISMNFSTGDSGDFTFDFPQFDPASVSAPADSPYATGVGGVSLSLDKTGAIAWQAGWGTNETLLASQGTAFDPAENFGFDFGAGGGTSAVFAKPAYQSALPGKFRKLPDISWLADPFTGGVIALSQVGTSPSLVYTVYGGTSLSCPMFSGLWAIANQAAGTNLGLASAAVYGVPASALFDITPVGSATNVTATFAGGKPKQESAAQLAAPLVKSKTFLSAVWDYPLNPGTALVLTFGTDSGLVTAPGWDNVTGVGVPQAVQFVGYFTPH